jgi:hypothetical protein
MGSPAAPSPRRLRGSGDVFTSETVDRVVAMLPGSSGARYPVLLRAAGVEGGGWRSS